MNLILYELKVFLISMTKSLVFGAGGGIGRHICSQLIKANHSLVAVGRNQIDFSSTNSGSHIFRLLSDHRPDWVINCAGILGDNQSDYHEIFSINLGSNWDIIRYYLQNPPETLVRIVMLGSSAYRSGRKNYILYASSKAALHNLWQGASENFNDTNVKLGIIHFGPVNTPMARTSLTRRHDPEYISSQILDFCANMAQSQSLELDQ